MLWTRPSGSDESGSAPAAYKLQLSSKEKFLLDWIVADDESTFIDGGDDAFFSRGIQRVTAKEVSRKYEDNEVAADQEYKGKSVLLEGVVQDIQSGIRDEPFLVLNGVNMFLGPQVKFKSPDMARIAAIRKGEKIRLFCIAAGEVIGKPFFDDCVFLDVYSAERKSKILSDVDQYLRSGNSDDKKIPVIVLFTLGFSRLIPDDSPCFSDQSKCKKAFDVKVLDKDKDDALKQSLELMRSKGLAVPDMQSEKNSG